MKNSSSNSSFNHLVVTAFLGLGLLIFLGLSRILLSFWQSDRVSQADGWSQLILQGARIDLATVSLLLIFPLFIMLVVRIPTCFSKVWNVSYRTLFSIIIFVVIFLELATPSFILEYNVRPNRIFLEYLIYPKEVFPTLYKSHLFELLASMFICSLSVFIWLKLTKKTNFFGQGKAVFWTRTLAIPVFLLMAFCVRSTTGHRPLNPAMVYFSNDQLVNSLVLNSLYSTGFSLRQMLSEDSLDYQYGKLPNKKVINIVRDLKGISHLKTSNTGLPTLSMQQASHKGPRKNLVIILEESLGARFVGSLGGLPLTPNIDQLSKESWFFNSMLATGTRSVRGIEATITGFTPTNNRAVVKLDKSQSGFFTIAELLRRKGYQTEFIYGGESHFDNMRSFFLGNGFEKITEEDDYVNPIFTGSWGVSDEDLLNRAHQNLLANQQLERPFFSFIFTSSNHVPFEYPEGKISPYDSPHSTRNNAIKYADWALGRFFEKAKAASYWDNTVFVVLADHDTDAHGEGLVPPKSFHIPAFIIGDGIKPRVDQRLVSNLDIPVTLLSLIGVDNYNPMIGRDLTIESSNISDRAYLQYHQNFAMIEGDNMTVLQPNKAPVGYKFSKSDFSTRSLDSVNEVDKNKAIAVAIWGKLAYQNRLYGLPKNKTLLETSEKLRDIETAEKLESE